MMLARHIRLQTRQFSAASSGHWLGSVPMGPADPILGLTERFNKVPPDDRSIHLRTASSLESCDAHR